MNRLEALMCSQRDALWNDVCSLDAHESKPIVIAKISHFLCVGNPRVPDDDVGGIRGLEHDGVLIVDQLDHGRCRFVQAIDLTIESQLGLTLGARALALSANSSAPSPRTCAE